MPKKLWDSRFKKKSHSLADNFLRSISFDKELAESDIKGSIVHAKMLGKCGVIKKSEAKKLALGLNSLLNKLKRGKLKFKPKEEDVHTAVTNLLYNKVGKVADKLHTARSRNDQVALDTRMYCKNKLVQILKVVGRLQKSLLKFAKSNIETMIPAYTHMQPAQCVSLAHYVLAYLEMLERDKERFKDAYKRSDEMPLGSCALSGTHLKIDRKYVAKLLGFSKISQNSIDAVSDRDFVIEILSVLAIVGMHLSRMSEDFILWSTKEYGFIDIDESFCTGSSIMPHKKNPDVLEYIRGYVGKSYGNLMALLATMKGLTLSYNRDMQHDKELLFDSVDTAIEMLRILADLIRNIKVSKQNIKRVIDKDIGIYSVDIAEDFVKNENLSYKEAHKLTGQIMRDFYDKEGKNKEDLNKRLFPGDSYKRLLKNTFEPKKSVNLKTSLGGTATKLVRKKIKNWENKLKNA